VEAAVVYENGKTAGFTKNVVLLVYYGGFLFHENTSSSWYAWNNVDWAPVAGDPRLTTDVSASGATIPSSTVLIDKSYNAWTVTSGTVYENGSDVGNSANVVLLLYYNNEFYIHDSFNEWYYWSNNVWNHTTGDPR
jgi:hypothetical protein